MQYSTAAQLGFKSFDGDEENHQLVIQGQMPTWLQGTFLRNGPAKYEVNSHPFRHWFDGLVLLSRFKINNQNIQYQSKYLRSNAYLRAQDSGTIKSNEFGTKADFTFIEKFTNFPPQITDNASVNTTQVGESILALTESPFHWELSLDNLDTLGLFKYRNKISCLTTSAHPHFDFARNELINVATKISLKCHYYILRMSPETLQQEIITKIPVKNPAYMHTFAMTENYYILVECPLVLVHPMQLLLMNSKLGKPYIENFHWMPERGSQFIVVDKQSGKIFKRYKTDAFFTFHTINAYEKDKEIIIDLCGYDDSQIVNSFYFDKINQGAGIAHLASVRRFVLPLAGETARSENIKSLVMDFPRLNYRQANSQTYQYFYGTGLTDPKTAFLQQLVKVDMQNQDSKIWREENCYPGEPVFVAKPDAAGEDEGVILTIVFNAEKKSSYLLILDSQSFQEIARAQLPHQLPYGLHGQFYSN